MQADVRQTLRRVNESFYQSFAAEFSATRGRLQPGVLRAIQNLPAGASLLDLGCGNGRLAGHLFRHGFHGRYTGLDLSEALLDEARAHTAVENARFVAADLNEAGWPAALRTAGGPEAFDHALAFAVLHHIPGAEARAALVRSLRTLLATGGTLSVSTWDFLASDRLKNRILPWEQAGLTAQQVEPGDYLLDWRRGGAGQRYVHHFTPQSLGELALSGGFTVVETFRSDGENGRLGLYQVWDSS